MKPILTAALLPAGGVDPATLPQVGSTVTASFDGSATAGGTALVAVEDGGTWIGHPIDAAGSWHCSGPSAALAKDDAADLLLSASCLSAFVAQYGECVRGTSSSTTSSGCGTAARGASGGALAALAVAGVLLVLGAHRRRRSQGVRDPR